MNKLMTVVTASVCAVSLSGAVVAAENKSVEGKAEVDEAEAEGLVEQMHDVFEAGFDLDFFSAYVWRNAVQTDEPVLQPCVWADLTYFEPFWLGFSVWQNYDLTSRRRESLRGGLTETDYNFHLGATAWQSEDETMSLDLELGHDWYVNQRVKSASREDYRSTSELYLKATFNNEFVNVYGQASWMYDDYGAYRKGWHYEVGLNRELDVATLVDMPEETLMLGVDWNVSFADPHYLFFLYGGVDYQDLDGDGEDDTWSNPDSGIAGTTVKVYLAWNITDWVSLVGTIAYTGVLNDSARKELDNGGWWEDDKYSRDLLWGGASLKFSF